MIRNFTASRISVKKRPRKRPLTSRTPRQGGGWVEKRNAYSRTYNPGYMGRHEEYELLLKLKEQIRMLHVVICHMTSDIEDNIDTELGEYE